MIRIEEPGIDAFMATPERRHFLRVVAGIDFGSASLAGARWAFTHLAPGADVLFTHVVPAEHSPAAPTLRGGLGGFAATLDVGSARTAVRIGRPSYWLDRLAAEFDAALVVLGRRQDAMRRRIGESGVVERLARRTRLPVLVVPEGVVEAPRCIIAAVDGGSSGVEVLAAATALATACGLPLTALHVLAPPSGPYDRLVGVRGRAAAMPAHGSRMNAGEGVTLVVGDAAREIAAAGIAGGGGVLVVGKRGADHSPVGSLGSVARALLATSPLPVLAIDTSGPSSLPASAATAGATSA